MMLIYERLYVVLVVIAMALVGAWVVTENMDPVYRAQARFYLPTQTESFSLTSEDSNLPNSAKFPTANAETQDSLLGLLNSAELRKRVSTRVPERDSLFIEKNVDIAIDKFNYVVVTAWDTEPRLAETVANEYVTQLQAHLEASSNAAEGRMRATLARTIDEYTESIQTLTSEKLELMSAHNSVDYGSEFSALQSRIDSLRNQIAELDIQLSSIEDQRSIIQTQRDARPEFAESGRSEIANPRIAQLRSEIGALQTEIAGLQLKYLDDHPIIIEKQTLLLAKSNQLAAEEERVEGSRNYTPDSMRADFDRQLSALLISETSMTKEREARQALLDAALVSWQAMPAFKTLLDDFSQRIAKKRQMLNDARLREQEFGVYESVEPIFIEIGEIAVAGSKPHLPNLSINMLVAAVLGLVMGMALAVTMARVGNTWEAEPW